MKLVRQIALHYQEGSSDKVYEVDLCEVATGKYVVNFRYGRRGSTLRDGSKTALPVDLAKAERIYDKLVTSKLDKGYQETSAAPARPTPAAAPAPAVAKGPPAVDPRHIRLVTLLGDPRLAWTSLDKLLFRVSELRVPAAVPTLIELLDGADGKRTYLIVRALLRAGDPSALPSLFRLWEDRSHPDNVRALAAWAIRDLASGEDRERFLRRQVQQVPEGLLAAYEGGRLEPVIADLADLPVLLHTLYLIDTEARRPHLLALLAQVPFRPPYFQQLRRVFKAAEARADGEVFGVLSLRFDRERAMYNRSYWGGTSYVPGVGRVKPSDPRVAWSSATRKWFRRRVWRTLRRLGEAGLGADYVALAGGVLLAVDDADSSGPRQRSYYDYASRRQATLHYPVWSRHWALSQVLYRDSARYAPTYRSLTFRCVGGYTPGQPAPDTREEAFSDLWDDRPAAVVPLLARSRCEAVHDFAARVFRAHPDAWPKVPTQQLLALFSSPFAVTGELAADLAVARYDPQAPDLELVLALASCGHERARHTAHGWIRANPSAFLRDVEFLTQLVLNPQRDTRRVALDVLAATALPAGDSRVLVDNVLDHARHLDPDDPEATERLRDAAAVLLTAFSQELKELSLDLVAELVAHPAEGVAELGAKILLGHNVRPPELPDTLLAAVMTSDHAVVRGIGIRLYGELSDAVLAERFRVLCDLVTHRHPDVRSAVRPIVARLAATNPSFAAVILRALVPAIVIAGPEGMHADVVRLLRDELAGALERIDTPTVMRLIGATEGVVQQLGGELLRDRVDPSTLTIAQIAGLASSDIAAVRQASWAMLDARVADASAEPEQLIVLLDATWNDSRQFAFHYVDQQVGPEVFGPELAVAVCDSVRPDVQAFGRRLVTRRFEGTQGLLYLTRIAQHPSEAMQRFASGWLTEHGAGDADRLAALEPYFLAVLMRINAGAIAKQRVLAFLRAEAATSEAAARVVVRVLTALAATIATTYRAQAIEGLVDIATRWPEVPTPLNRIEPEVRDAV